MPKSGRAFKQVHVSKYRSKSRHIIQCIEDKGHISMAGEKHELEKGKLLSTKGITND
jgi:hypothetical protein